MNWKIQNNKNRRLMFEVRSHWGPPTLCKNNSVMLFFVRFIERNGEEAMTTRYSFLAQTFNRFQPN